MSVKKKSLKQRLAEKKKELQKSKGGGGYILRQKEEGTIRLRVLPVGEDNDFVQELTTFWLGDSEVISPATIGEPCALMEKYQELKSSKDEDDMELAKKLVPRSKYVMPVVMYKDEKGKEVDTENSERLFQVAGGTYQDIIDLYLDEDEWGDMTDPNEGYDIKITRTGKGKNDTKYSVMACKNTPLPKEYKKKVVNLEEMVKSKVSSYEDTVEKLNTFLGTSSDDEDDDKPKKKSSKLKDKTSKDKPSSKSKKRRRDL